MTNSDRLRLAKRVLTTLEELPVEAQRELLRCLKASAPWAIRLRRALATLETEGLTETDRDAVLGAVQALLGSEVGS